MLEPIIIQDIATKERSPVSFFPDDTIEVVRQRIGIIVNTHPDRLFILAEMRRPQKYFIDDPRRWEALFYRLSYRTPSILRNVFHAYQTEYRVPTTNAEFKEFGIEEWMEIPKRFKSDEATRQVLEQIYAPSSDFSEYVVFGTQAPMSYVLPFEYDDSLVSQIPQAGLPIPQKTSLLNTLYSVGDIKGFIIKKFDTSAEPVKSVYFPFLTTQSPERIPDESIALMNKLSPRLDGLLELAKSLPEPKLTILRTRFYVPWIDTDFGSAIRTKFEQMFYGLTVSKKTPYVGLFTAATETMRHKFYVENVKHKEAYLDMNWWAGWYAKSKPARNRPTLVLYNGTSPHNFDRISITSEDIVIGTYRAEGNTQDLKELQKDMYEWILSLDAIVPFISKRDIEMDRWELQDMNVLATYKKKIDTFDLRRSDCVSFLYDMSGASNSTFRLLRSDHSVDGLTALEVKVLQMMKADELITAADVQKQLDVSPDIARKVLRTCQLKVQEDKNILNKSFRGFPTMQVGTHTMMISSVNSLDLPVQYATLLRFILSDPTSKDLDELCQKRLETGRVEAGIAPAQTVEEDAELMDEYEDMFAYIGEEGLAKGEEVIPDEAEAFKDEEIEVFRPKQMRNTLYSYFNSRLKKFDPELFNDPEYPTRCEQKNQPILLNDEDLQRLSSTPYDPRKYGDPNRILELKEPGRTQGIAVCPEYWCILDEIPLRETDLLNEGGTQKCPICKGRIKTAAGDSPKDFTVIQRDKAYGYPGFTNYKSPKTKSGMPCCFKTPETGSKGDVPTSEEKYYVLTETKIAPPLRFAFLSRDIIGPLSITETYPNMTSVKRLQRADAGFFRVGLGRPAETLSKLLGLNTAITRPSESIETTIKCSFLATWTGKSESNIASIRESLRTRKLSLELAPIIASIDDAFRDKELTILQELEYTSILLQCDVFRIHSDTKTLGCMFYSPIAKPRTRGIIALQTGNIIDVLAHVSRKGNSLTYKANVFADPFKKETYEALEKLKNQSCSTPVPSYEDAMNVLKELNVGDEHKLILDPYGRVQAIYVPNKLVLPFKPSAEPIDPPPLIPGYSGIDLPTHEKMKAALKIAERFSSGYKWKEDLVNIDWERTEILLESGLRVPVEAEEAEDLPEAEVIQTVQEVGEDELAFGGPDEELQREYSEISYAAEIFDFLLFELSEDLKEKEPALRNVLKSSQPKKADVDGPLKKWFEKVTRFTDIRTADTFVSKVRQPCGQFLEKDKCNKANVCGWYPDAKDGKCKVQINQSLKKDKLFNRLLTTMVDNAKLRGMVMDGRSTPFFSTILYIELPHELILTDNDLRSLA